MVHWYGAGTLDNLLATGRADRLAVLERQLYPLMDEHYQLLGQAMWGHYTPITGHNKAQTHAADMVELEREGRGLIAKVKKAMGR